MGALVAQCPLSELVDAVAPRSGGPGSASQAAAARASTQTASAARASGCGCMVDAAYPPTALSHHGRESWPAPAPVPARAPTPGSAPCGGRVAAWVGGCHPTRQPPTRHHAAPEEALGRSPVWMVR